MSAGKVFYYTDEQKDDFAGNKIATKPLPEDYEYFPSGRIRKGIAFFLHHFIATPVCYLFLKIASGQKIVGKKKIRPYRKSGYFLYGNHTRKAGDAFTPSMIAFPKKPYLVVHPDALSIRGVRRIVEDLGAMPIPDSFTAEKKFCAAVQKRMQKGSAIAIYPEAHIWPFYTKIRPFPDTSFGYPVMTGKPAFSFTTTFRRRKTGGVKATVYIDGPFFPDQTLPKREQKAKLRNEIYFAMTEQSKRSSYSPNRFIDMRQEKPS